MLSFETTNVDFGNIQYGTVASQRVNVLNLNSEAITPQVPQGSCSCTTGFMEPPTIEGYRTGSLTVNFNSGKVGKGIQQKTLTISYTFQGKMHYQVITVTANVV